MTNSPRSPTPPEPETPILLTAPEIPMTPHPSRVLRPSTPQVIHHHVFSPIGRTPGSKRTPTRNSRFRRRLRSSIMEGPSRTPTPTPTPSPSTTPTNTPTPPCRCTPSYTKAQTHITNLRSILSRVHTLNLKPSRFSPEVRKSLAGIEWGLYFLLEGGDVYQYLFPKKEGRGRGVWMDADVEGLVRRSGFWVRVWRGVRDAVGDFEEGVGGKRREEAEEAENIDSKRKREVEHARGKGQCAKKGRYREGE